MAKDLRFIGAQDNGAPALDATPALFALCTLVISLGGCGGDTPIDTGLTGVMLRGPIAPVCSDSLPCDAPFAASFSVQHGGGTVLRFGSAPDGTFTVLLPPGSYRIVPGTDAPIISPTTQVKDVVVGDSGLTTDTLVFDTGIR